MAFEFILIKGDTCIFRQLVNCHKTDIMTSTIILQTRISKSDKTSHILHLINVKKAMESPPPFVQNVQDNYYSSSSGSSSFCSVASTSVSSTSSASSSGSSVGALTITSASSSSFSITKLPFSRISET